MHSIVKKRKAQRSQTNSSSEYFEDSSLIYVRDRHGTLHTPPGYEERRRSASPPKDSLPLEIVHGATCSFKTTLTQQSPCKLYKICRNLVAKNLHLVESFVDFPEEIGYEIFHEALQAKVFNHSPEYIRIFSVAYGSLVLKHLNLRQSTAFINEKLSILQCFDKLTKLDLAHCKLGDQHEYLKWIGKMQSLQCICLKDNCLTDVGISLWSLPHRMFKSGPESLQKLDLSCNPNITDSCAKCLARFLQLKSLNLSGTSFTLMSGIKKIMKLTNLKLVSYIPDFSKNVLTKTKGWALPIISELSSVSTHTKPDKSKPAKNSFYKAVGCLAESTIKKHRIKECEKNCNNYPTMLLQSEELVLPDTLRNIDNSLRKQDRKRIVDNGLILGSSCKKRKLTTLEHDSDNDELGMSDIENLHDSSCNLLESYLKYL